MLNFKSYLESLLISKELIIKQALSHEIPEYFIHRTDSIKDIDNIKKNGFSLKHFGRTGRKYNVSSDLVQYDPKGIYCLPYRENEENNDSRPYIIFSANLVKCLIFSGSGGSAKGKQWLYNYYHAKGSADFSSKLLKDGYQAILSKDSECIILDISSIRIL